MLSHCEQSEASKGEGKGKCIILFNKILILMKSCLKDRIFLWN
jgi:hypothetical protein